ncbi:hypothetical protein GCM10023083_91030 [Streptomyces phyllanthi]
MHGQEAAWPGITQTAPDEESEAEWNASLGEESQVSDDVSLLPEADLAIAEAAARLVPRARATSENIASEAESGPADAEEPDL